jgi:hypothetical protein
LRRSESYLAIVYYLQVILHSSIAIPAPPPDIDLFHERQLWRNDYDNAHGDISFHLAYTYLRSGKLKYALEEAREASICYKKFLQPYDQPGDHVTIGDLSDYNNKVRRDESRKLRHVWGLIAIITCQMGTSPEILEECQMAIRNIGNFDLGPVEGN